MDKKRIVYVMGVSGCGKTTLSRRLCEALGSNGVVHDADDDHTQEARDRMQSGRPLTDEYRESWLDRVQASALSKLSVATADSPTIFVACSALKEIYRARLVRDLPSTFAVAWIYLCISPEIALERIKSRGSHFFADPDLARAQFDLLQEPVGDLRVQISPTIRIIASHHGPCIVFDNRANIEDEIPLLIHALEEINSIQ
eukprot:TRINITY_DN16686_c0_g1_i1.p1 TRINITY_DN16686_c0_g1~~TRINITY_DN16686_c0_g1_i1.p1  ORF type:complete len:200 (+),score=32.64 TRINITY_DN16686_c0_g1_i1:58-657(+)